jgi:hypothetical protein
MLTVYLQVYLGDLFVKFLFLVLQLFSRITGGCERKECNIYFPFTFSC